MGASKKNSTQNGRAVCINQLFAARTFCREVYGGIYFFFFLSINFACMLGPWAPNKASFCKNLLLCHLSAFFSLSLQLSLRSNPSFLQGNGFTMVYLYLHIFAAFLLQCWRRVKCFVSSYTMKGCHHISPTRRWGAPCAPSAPPIVQFPSITFHTYKDLTNRSA